MKINKSLEKKHILISPYLLSTHLLGKLATSPQVYLMAELFQSVCTRTYSQFGSLELEDVNHKLIYGV